VRAVVVAARGVREQLGDPVYAIVLIAVDRDGEGCILMSEWEDVSFDHEVPYWRLLADDPDACWLANGALTGLGRAEVAEADVGGHPLTVAILVLTMKGSAAELRIGFAWKDELGRAVANRLKPDVVRLASALANGTP
jgi:hypothetical protein